MAGEYKKGKCDVRSSYDSHNVYAWMDGFAYFIRPEERDLFRFDPKRAANIMHHKQQKNLYRCTRCGWEGKKEEFTNGYMAELLCVACNKDSVEEYKRDIATGNICRICKKPRSRCVC